MRPAWFANTRQLERSLLMVSVRSGFNQHHQTILIAEVQASIGVGDGSRSLARIASVSAPADFAGEEFDADGQSHTMAVAGVDIITDQDKSAMMILKRLGVEEINLLGIHAIVRGLQLDQRCSGLIGGGCEDVIAAYDRS